jgi:hypothetical protein
MSIQKYFTKEERRIAHNKTNEKYRRSKEIVARKKFNTENERIAAGIEYQKQYYQNHKKEKLKKEKEYRKNHKEERNLWARKHDNEKYETNIKFKLAKILRSRMRLAIHNNQRAGSAVRDLGCSIPELKIYLENKFQEGMTWENWKHNGWHIDHVIPLDNFNLQNREEFLKACHYTNLQPLWAEENLSKHNKVI